MNEYWVDGHHHGSPGRATQDLMPEHWIPGEDPHRSRGRQPRGPCRS